MWLQLIFTSIVVEGTMKRWRLAYPVWTVSGLPLNSLPRKSKRHQHAAVTKDPEEMENALTIACIAIFAEVCSSIEDGVHKTRVRVSPRSFPHEPHQGACLRMMENRVLAAKLSRSSLWVKGYHTPSDSRLFYPYTVVVVEWMAFDPLFSMLSSKTGSELNWKSR